MKTVCVICARGGSKGVPRKNIRPLAGKPLIAHTIDIAKACPSISRIVVSTDDEEIADVARKFGAEVPFLRPAELSSDTSRHWDVWRHLVSFLQQDGGADLLVDLHTTSPMRSVDDVESTIALVKDHADSDAAITVTPARRSPYFNMVTIDESARAKIMLSLNKDVNHRQAAPAAYDMTTVAYAVRSEYICQHESLFAGNVYAHVVDEERAIDIDTPLDFEIADFLMKRRNAHADD